MTLQSSGIHANPVMLRGDAAKEIIEYTKEQHINLIVSGPGLSQFKGWLLGSVSRKLVHYSEGSVLVVRVLLIKVGILISGFLHSFRVIRRKPQNNRSKPEAKNHPMEG